MQLISAFTAVIALVFSVAPIIALPAEGVAGPEAALAALEARADRCDHSQHLKGSGCDPKNRGRLTCSANFGAVVSRSIPFLCHAMYKCSTSGLY